MIQMRADLEQILQQIADLRAAIEPHFRLDTAAQGFRGTTASTGHCATAAVILHTQLGGEFVSAIVDGGSHWFNRIETAEGQVDIDITADQFEREPIETAVAGKLYPGTRVRQFADLNTETLQRARLLARRAALHDVVGTLDEVLATSALAASR